MKTQRDKLCLQIQAALVIAVVSVIGLAAQSALGNGAPYYLDPNGGATAGFDAGSGTYNEADADWNPNANGIGTLVAFPGVSPYEQMTFGNGGTALPDMSGTFTVNLNGNRVNGIAVLSSNINVTIGGNGNVYNSAADTWTVVSGSTLTDDETRQQFDAGSTASLKGFNWNKNNTTLAGGGTMNFQTPLGCNEASGHIITEDMPGGTVNFEMANTSPSGAGTYAGGFTLQAGELNFASAGSANQFYGFTAGNNFAVNGGTIDNTSGSALTLNFAGGGGISIGGSFTFAGSANLDFGTAHVALTASPTITVSSNTLAMDGNLSDGGSGYGISKLGNGTLACDGTSNVFSGATIVNAGALVFGSFPTSAATVTVASGAALDVSAACPVTLGASQLFDVTNATLTVGFLSSSTAITTPTLNVGGASNVINVASLPVGATFPLQLSVISYGTMTGTFNFSLGTMPRAGYTAYLSNDVAHSSVDLVVVSGPVIRALTWGGTVNGNWDTTTANWVYQGSPTTYNPGDFVQFGDAATGQTNISLTTVLTPGGLTVSNNTLTYNLGDGNSGGGYISGSISLEKDGTGLLILDDAGNNFTGGLNINSGTVQAGNNDGLGYLGAGPVINNGALVFDHSANDADLTNSIFGTGTLTQEGGDTLQLAGVNTFTGNVQVNNNSTLQLGSATGLGGDPAVTVTSGSALDLNGFSAGTSDVTVSGSGVGGNGAMINSGAEQDNALQFVTLAGDTTFGGSGRWDIRTGAGGAALSTGGNPYNLTKTGLNQVSLVSTAVDPALGNVDVQQGTLALQEATTGLGNPADTLTIESGATLEFYSLTNQLDKVVTLVGGGPGAYSIVVDKDPNTILGPVTLSGTTSTYINVGTSATTPASLALDGTVTGQVLGKDGSGALIINGNASNAGITADTGLLILNGTCNGPILCNSIIPAAFAGSGTNFGTTELAGAFYPGGTNTPGTITLAGLTLDAGATVYVDLAATNTVGGGVNDLIQVNGNLTINGNSVVINPIGLLQSGASYRLANYTGTLTMNGNLSVSSPDGYTFTVDTSTPGQINLVPSGGPPVWNGGSAIDSDWSDSANWGGAGIASGNVLGFAGNNRLINTNDTAVGTTYGDIDFNSDAGAFVLNGNPIVMGGNINSFSTNVETVNLPLNFGNSPIFNGGTGGIIIAGSSTNTLASGTETNLLAGKGILVDSIATAGAATTLATTPTANWTILDNASDTPISIPGNLNVYEGGALTFGSTNSAPNLTLQGSGSTVTAVGDTSGTSVLNMVNGTLTLETRLNVGNGTAGAVLNVSGGVLNAEEGHGVSIADNNPTTVGAINVSGGTLNCGPATNVTANTLFVATRGTGTLTVSGTGAVNCSTLDVSRNASSAGSTGTVNLNGGTLTAASVSTGTSATGTGGSPTATFNFNGGTLAAAASVTNWYQGRTSAPAIPIVSIVKSGGAVIDSAGFSVGVLEVLQHDTALGGTPDGGLTKLGSGTLTLAAINTYNGPTVISNGTLQVDGAIKGSGVSVAGGVLAGVGSIAAPVAVEAGGTLAPGDNGIGTLSITNSLSLAGVNQMDVNKTNGIVSSDLITGVTSLTLGGTLQLNLTGAALASGDSIKLYSAGSITGSFAGIVPATPGAGLAWDTSALDSQGILKVTPGSSGGPTIGGTSVSNGNVMFTVTGGTAGTTLYVLTSTNLALPLADWTPVTTNQFDSNGSYSFTNAVSGNPRRFFIIQEQ